jgi:hypothetical protein
MIKRVISFTEPQDDWLIKESDRLGISVAELVRRIIDLYREPHLKQLHENVQVQAVSPEKE